MLPIVIIIIVLNPVQCVKTDWFYWLLTKEITNNPDCNIQKNAFLEALENRELWALQSK